MLGIDIRFYLDELPDKVVGWQVSHKFNEFQDLHKELLDPYTSDLTPDCRLLIPDFPKLDFGSYAKRINREHNEKLAKEVEGWLKRFLDIIPSIDAEIKRLK